MLSLDDTEQLYPAFRHFTNMYLYVLRTPLSSFYKMNNDKNECIEVKFP